MSLNCVVIYGSVRTGRQGIKAARFVTSTLEKRGHSVTLIDPMEYVLPLLDKRYKEYDAGTAPEVMEKLSKHLAAADAVVVVSGEYNSSVPPALKNLLDHFNSEYVWKPAGIVTYSAGPFGGSRVGGHLRSILSGLGMVTLPTVFAISQVGKSFDDDGRALDESYDRRVGKFAEELEWYGAALKLARVGGIPF